MCGRSSLGEPSEIAARYGFKDFHELQLPPPRFNVAPSQLVPTIVNGPGRA